MSAQRTRVERGVVRAGVALPGAPAPGNCQRKSSRGAGAEPLQGLGIAGNAGEEATPTLSSYLRDKSDRRNGANPVSGQQETGNFEINDSCSETAVEPEFLSDASPRDKPWDGHRGDADEIADMYSRHPEFQKLGVRVRLCSLWLGFAWAPDRLDSRALTLKLREARFCRVRHCPICQWRRSLMWLARFYAALPRVRALHPTARFLFLTLTWKNVPIDGLRCALCAMNAAWARLSQRRAFAVVLGCIRTTEVTRGKDGRAHPHFHVLLMVPASYFGKGYLSHAKWVELWRGASRIDYSPVVDIRAVRRADDDAGIGAALRETLKYAVKPSDMKADANWFLEMTRQLSRLRFIASGGALRNVLRPEEETEQDLLLLKDGESGEESASVFFNWKRIPKRYKRDAKGLA